jgi:hypothetical protein
MEQTRLSRAEIGERGEVLYAQRIRTQVETQNNIGKMVVIDVETGDYAIDELGLEAARHLQAKHPNAHLYGKRIGYDVSEALGGVIERVAP